MATVGGNLCMSLPAGPMISLTAALDGVCTIWTPEGDERRIAVIDFVLAPLRNALEPGELLRADRLADVGAAPTHRLPADLAEPARPLRRAC